MHFANLALICARFECLNCRFLSTANYFFYLVTNFIYACFLTVAESIHPIVCSNICFDVLSDTGSIDGD